MRRPLPLLIVAALVAGGCGKGTVTNDDDVSRDAAIHAVESFFDAVHDGRHDAACALLPGPQRGGLARLSAVPSRTAHLRRRASDAARIRPRPRAGPADLRPRHPLPQPLPHKSKRAIDQPTVGGRMLGAVGLRREGETWSVAFVCECP